MGIESEASSQVAAGRFGRVLIIHPEGNTSANPSLTALIGALLGSGVSVDLRCGTSRAASVKLANVRTVPYGRWLRVVKQLIIDQLCAWGAVLPLAVLEWASYYRGYDLIVGVDRAGVIEAAALGALTRTPYVMMSFEMMFEVETSKRFKRLERRACRGAAAWIVQDEIRAAQLERENELPSDRKILLPLASGGVGVPSEERIRDCLSIPRDKHVAAMIGSLTYWSLAPEVIASTASWPEDWVLLVHERYGQALDLLGRDPEYHKAVESGRVYVSLTPTETVDEMGCVLAGVSAGIALYHPDPRSAYTGLNLQHLGMASGKIATYLRYGIPVVMNEIGLYAAEARMHGFGVVVDGPKDIGAVLRELSDPRWRAVALRYFTQRLDFELYREGLLEALDNCVIDSHPVHTTHNAPARASVTPLTRDRQGTG
ncbi:MAG: hypothetical protein Q8P50_06375 [Bacillota bacterium]|nr:hypothetical protein [Bacillota bacterium]